MLFLFSCFWNRQTWVNVQFALNKNCALEVYGVFAVYDLGFSSKQFQSCNKSLINQACSGPAWENIGPWSFLYVLSRPRADILQVRSSCLVNKIYVMTGHYENFSRLDCSFELWVKLRSRGRKQQKRWLKYNYIFNNWKISIQILL